MRRDRFGFSALFALTALLALVAVAGCGGSDQGAGSSGGEASTERRDVILASTSSTRDSGLFDELIPAFQAAHPEYVVKVVAMGTGAALEFGRNRDADVLLVHDPESEKEFVAEGYGTERREVMYNDFVIVGPPDDPAGIAGSPNAGAALTRVARAEAAFISRGDESGTHNREVALWASSGIEPSGNWYQAAGQGMGEVLRIASESAAYTLTDRASYLYLMENLQLEVLLEGDGELFNQYGVIPVAGAANSEGAQAFAAWVTSAEGQEMIAAYGVERFGMPMFFPNAGRDAGSSDDLEGK